MGHKGYHMRSHGKYHITDKYLKRSKGGKMGGPTVTYLRFCPNFVLRTNLRTTRLTVRDSQSR